MISFKDKYDAIVIGAGPAGSTTGALLAEKGHDVLIVEKEKFPRYHVGESLMPFCYFSLERLGLIEKLHHSENPRKFCVQFVRQNGSVSQPFYFFQHMDHPSSTTWQVWRSEFDPGSGIVRARLSEAAGAGLFSPVRCFCERCR